jgi:hypothetical protein
MASDSYRQMFSLVALVAFLLPQSSNQEKESAPLARLQAKIEVVSLRNFTSSELAAQYRNPTAFIFRAKRRRQV